MKIQLDTVLDTHEELGNVNDFLNFLIEHNILMNVLTWNGPGGGHPLVEYEGTEESLKLLLSEIFERDEKEIKWHLAGCPSRKCDSCNGTGQAYVSCCTQEIVDSDYAMCPVCKEHLGEEDCPDCDGTGVIEDVPQE